MQAPKEKAKTKRGKKSNSPHFLYLRGKEDVDYPGSQPHTGWP